MTEQIPEIYVKVSDLEFNINFVVNSLNPDFLKQNSSLPFQDRIFRAFPELSGRICSDMVNEEVRDIVRDVFELKYKNEQAVMLEKTVEIQDKLKRVIVPALPVLFQEFNLSWK